MKNEEEIRNELETTEIEFKANKEHLSHGDEEFFDGYFKALRWVLEK